eukprot:3335191-Prymnesium_polylepis.1
MPDPRIHHTTSHSLVRRRGEVGRRFVRRRRRHRAGVGSGWWRPVDVYYSPDAKRWSTRKSA